MVTLEAIRTPSIRESVAEALRSALREGKLKPGEDLSEASLANQFQVSRGPVREALFALAEEGLLAYSNNKGFTVPSFTREDRNQIDQVRLLLETRALELARPLCTTGDIARLEELKARMIALYLDGHVPARDTAEMAFHGAVWELSGNPWLVRSLRRVMVPYFTYSRVFRLQRPDLTLELFSSQHQDYIDYLSGASRRTAEECVRYHLGL